uniref:Uncharacterized protein n=1 Tax=Brassica campestris TaxID=3711 RepID=M4D823_BRACM
MGNSHVKILKNKKTIHIKQPPQESDQLLQAGHTPTVIIQVCRKVLSFGWNDRIIGGKVAAVVEPLKNCRCC